MKLLTAGAMRQLEAAAVEEEGLDYLRLMENAGAAAARIIRSRYEVEGKRVTVLCGAGNNGGDGFVIARKLLEEGADVRVVLTAGRPSTPQAAEMLARLSPALLQPIGLEEEPYLAADAVSSAALLVDAIYGIGFHGALPETIRPLLRLAASQAVPRAAVDIPSGMEADTGAADEDTLPADLTVTFSAAKPGLIAAASAPLCGRVEVADIGIGENLLNRFAAAQLLIDDNMVKECFSPRGRDSHKGTYGRLLLVCGSYGMAGAAMMATEAALRCGVGLAALALPRSLYPIAASRLCEPVFIPLPETAEGGIALSSRSILRQEAARSSALLAGCGLGGGEAAAGVIADLLAAAACPMVLDADGINAVAGHIDIGKTARFPSSLILTPHPGEMARLTGRTVEEIQRDRIGIAARFSASTGAIVVLKGHHTVIAAPGSPPLINRTGNPGMATGGSGDVLAGMIASFAAQGMEPLKAAMCGVYLHGMAGDRAAARLSQHALLPTDLIKELGGLFLNLEQ
ncbi:MAG: NAD(P)H-hydrate dehydratase [Clostridiales bacterium]|nr:NAD(P)H-hydrate dehydratase [Clostridiales bacterium]